MGLEMGQDVQYDRTSKELEEGQGKMKTIQDVLTYYLRIQQT